MACGVASAVFAVKIWNRLHLPREFLGMDREVVAALAACLRHPASTS